MTILNALKPYAKAIAAFAVSGVSTLALHFGLNLGDDVTGLIAALVIAVINGGVVYSVPNKAPTA